jgi:hypothetical protein
MLRFHFSLVAVLNLVAFSSAQDAVNLVERFDTTIPYRVELKAQINGQLALPPKKGEQLKVLRVSGESKLVYDERMIPSEEARTAKVLRIYRDVRFQRRIDDQDQMADIRPSVRRMVVLRSETGKKVPFSPDGPLTWGEIDVVRTDLFSPAVVTGLLPARAVQPGAKWLASSHAITDLTDLDPIEEGKLQVEFLAKVQLDGKSYARLALNGTAKGRTEDGFSQHRLSGDAYFDLSENRFSYLNLKGTNELLGPDGKVTGRVEGVFQMSRNASDRAADFTAEVVKSLKTTPSDENTLLLYDNPELGLKLEYPRRWRVGAVQGQQVTLEEGKGGSIVFTMLSKNKIPTSAEYSKEVQDFFKREKGTILASLTPRSAPGVEQFAFEVEINKSRVRMDYSIISQSLGGATAAARVPATDREELSRNIERILKSVQITKQIDR